MSVHAEQKSWSVPQLAQAREAGRRLTMLTCYDASFARVLDDAGIDLILIGDSLGMVVQGHDSTLPVRVEDIVYHTAAVARGASHALKIADFPFGSDAAPGQAVDDAGGERRGKLIERLRWQLFGAQLDQQRTRLRLHAASCCDFRPGKPSRSRCAR